MADVRNAQVTMAQLEEERAKSARLAARLRELGT